MNTEIQAGQIVYTMIDDAIAKVKVDEIYTDYCVVSTETRDYCRYKKDLYSTPEAVPQHTTNQNVNE